MRKYIVIFRNSIQNNLVYRFDMMSSFVAEIMNLVVLFYLWYSIYRQGNHLGNYDLSGLLVYFVLTRLLSLIMFYSDLGRIVSEEIKAGNIINFLLKPISYFWRTLSMSLGRIALRIVVFSPIAVFCFWYYSSVIKLTFINSLYFLLISICGTLIYFFYFYFIGILTFYFDDISGINYMAWLILSIFSGRIMPIDLFPAKALLIIDYLPFKFISFTPVQILMGNIPISNYPHEFILAFLWVCGFGIMARTLYYFGLKRYESYGI